MKRRCKHIEITDRDFVKGCIGTYLCNHNGRKAKRHDIVALFDKYKDVDGIADCLIEGIKTRRLDLKPIRMIERVDRGSNKRREIGLEDAKQQLYDQICVEALTEAAKCIGEYQCTCLRNQPKRIYHKKTHEYLRTVMKGRGQAWAKDAIYGWLQDSDINYAVQMDIYHNYASVDHHKLIRLLERKIKNEPLMWLIKELLKTVPQEDPDHPKGLIIGSTLSISLDAIYLSQLYHHMMEDAVKIRRKRDGAIERVRLCKHMLLWMDDINIFCTSEKNAKAAAKEVIDYCTKLGLKIKLDWRIINFKKPTTDRNQMRHQNYIDAVGFRIYRNKVTLRRRVYLAIRKAFKHDAHNEADARKIVSYKGPLMESNSYRFRKKYHCKRILRKARRYISSHDKSKIRQKAAGNHIQADGRRSDLCADMSA